MKRTKQVRGLECGGFTLTEVLIASSISVTIAAVAMGLYINVFRSWHGINLRMQADRDVNIAMSRLVYGVGDRRGIRAAKGIVLSSGNDGWTLAYGTGVTSPQSNSVTYSASAQTLVFNPGAHVIGRGVTFAQVYVQSHSIVVTLRVDQVEGALQARREIGTEIVWRN